jgi:anti-sigma factor RsiW
MAEPCAVVEPLLSAWLDGELEAGEVRLVTEHLAGCDGCARELRDLSDVSGLLRNSPVRQAPLEVMGARGGALDEPLRRARALAVATGLLFGAAFALGAGESEQRHVPAPMDVFVADQFGQFGQTYPGEMTPVFLDTRP